MRNMCTKTAGVPGFAAWVGIELFGDPKPGSNVFISAAAGAVGMYAGQLAKLKGCRVVGSTGSDEKVRHAIREIYRKCSIVIDQTKLLGSWDFLIILPFSVCFFLP